MKIVVLQHSEATNWYSSFFPEKNFYSLLLANKTIIEYIVDIASSVREAELLIVDDENNPCLEKALKNKSYWSVEMSCIVGEKEGSIEAIFNRHYCSSRDEPCFFVFGHILPKPASFDVEKFTIVNLEESTHEGLYFYDGRALYYSNDFHPIANLNDYVHLNFELLKSDSNYVLPSYQSQQNINYGMNVKIDKNCIMKGMVLVGDNSHIHGNCQLLSPVIIGENSIIADGVILKNTMVMPDTYIGSNMEFENKIVDKNKVIDIITGTKVTIDEKELVSAITNNTNFFHKIWKYLFCKKNEKSSIHLS